MFTCTLLARLLAIDVHPGRVFAALACLAPGLARNRV